jgi:hypothetical protein
MRPGIYSSPLSPLEASDPARIPCILRRKRKPKLITQSPLPYTKYD